MRHTAGCARVAGLAVSVAALVMPAASAVTPWTATEGTPAAGLPGLIDGIEIESHDHVPPIMDSNGNLYRVTEDYKAEGNNPQFMKSSDGGATWREQDAAHRSSKSDTETGWVVTAGRSIWFVWEAGDVHLTRFRTSDHPTRPDTYAVSTETAAVSPGVPSHNQYVSAVRNRDRSLWIAYGIEAEIQKIAFRKRVGPGRFTEQRILDARSSPTTAPRLVKGANDVTHIFFKDHGSHHIYWRRLTANGELSRARQVDSGGTHEVITPLTNAVYYDDDGVEVLVVAFADPNGVLKSVTIRDGAIGRERRISASPVMIAPEVVTNDAAVAHLAVHRRTVHAMWSDAANGHVLRDSRGNLGRWGDDRRVVDTGQGTDAQAQYVYCKVLTLPSDRQVLGFTYDVGPHTDDDSNIYYDQVPLR
jgi:hypothetical protein